MESDLVKLTKRAMKYEVGALVVSFAVGICFFGYRPLTVSYSLVVYLVLCMFYIFFHWESEKTQTD